MRDNPLITFLIATILAGEAAAGISGTPVKQAFQPTNQGVNTIPTAYMYKVMDHALGYPYVTDVWDANTDAMVHTEAQDYETTFQISALSTQDPLNQSQYTASDILNLIRYILQSTSTVAALTARGLGILRIDKVRNTPFIDDRNRNEYQPSMDFVIQHKQVIASTADVFTSIELDVYEV